MLKSNLEVNISDEKTSDYFSVHDTNDDIVTSATPCSSLSLASKSSVSILENLDSVQNKKSVIILKKDNIRDLPMDSSRFSTWKTTELQFAHDYDYDVDYYQRSSFNDDDYCQMSSFNALDLGCFRPSGKERKDYRREILEKIESFPKGRI